MRITHESNCISDFTDTVALTFRGSVQSFSVRCRVGSVRVTDTGTVQAQKGQNGWNAYG